MIGVPALQSFPVPGDPGALRAQANALIDTSSLLDGQSRQILSAGSGVATSWTGAAATAYQTYASTVASDFSDAAGRLADGSQTLYGYADSLEQLQTRAKTADKKSQHWLSQIVTWTTQVEDAQEDLAASETELAGAERDHRIAISRGGLYGSIEASTAAARVAAADRQVSGAQAELANAQHKLEHAQQKFNTWQAEAQSIQDQATSIGRSHAASIADVGISTPPALALSAEPAVAQVAPPPAATPAPVLASPPPAPAIPASPLPPPAGPAPVPASGSAQQKLAAMMSMARSLVGKPYIWGGGHAGFVGNETALPGFDCSGFVSAVLHAGGYLSAPQTTATLISQPGIAAGPGHYVTIWDRPFGSQGHVIININGNWFECGGNSAFNPAGGVAPMTPQGAAGELAGGGFQAYHPVGL